MTREIHNYLLPAEPTHPGDVLKEELAARGMTQTELARITGRPIQTINMIIKGWKKLFPRFRRISGCNWICATA